MFYFSFLCVCVEQMSMSSSSYFWEGAWPSKVFFLMIGLKQVSLLQISSNIGNEEYEHGIVINYCKHLKNSTNKISILKKVLEIASRVLSG